MDEDENVEAREAGSACVGHRGRPGHAHAGWYPYGREQLTS